jgi:hypothetical protein
MMLGVATATAQAGQTSETVDVLFNGTVFGIAGAFLRVIGSSIVRQVSPVAKVEGTGTTITTTFGAAPLVTSQVVAFVAQRTNGGAIVVPTDFTLLFNASSSTNARFQAAARIGTTSTTAQWTGLSSASAAKIAVALEIARPGDEL